MQRQLYKTKNTDKIKDLVNVIKSGLVDLENKIEEISENEIVSEKLYDIVNTNKFFYKFTDKLNLKKQNKYVVLANLSINYTWKNIKYACKNNIFKISPPTWNDEFDLPDGSYYISDIPDYFEYIIKMHETIAHNSLIKIYINKIKNRVLFTIKTGYKSELLSSGTMKLLGSTEKDVDRDRNGENARKLEIAGVILVHCNILNNNYQQASKVLFAFVPDKQFRQLITIAPQSLTMLKTTIAEFYYIFIH